MQSKVWNLFLRSGQHIFFLERATGRSPIQVLTECSAGIYLLKFHFQFAYLNQKNITYLAEVITRYYESHLVSWQDPPWVAARLVEVRH